MGCILSYCGKKLLDWLELQKCFILEKFELLNRVFQNGVCGVFFRSPYCSSTHVCNYVNLPVQNFIITAVLKWPRFCDPTWTSCVPKWSHFWVSDGEPFSWQMGTTIHSNYRRQTRLIEFINSICLSACHQKWNSFIFRFKRDMVVLLSCQEVLLHGLHTQFH